MLGGIWPNLYVSWTHLFNQACLISVTGCSSLAWHCNLVCADVAAGTPYEYAQLYIFAMKTPRRQCIVGSELPIIFNILINEHLMSNI